MNKTHDGQTSRILQGLVEAKGSEIGGMELSRIGSGKPQGWTASFSRRISDIRKLGYDVVCRSETADGIRHTFYRIANLETYDGSHFFITRRPPQDKYQPDTLYPEKHLA
jgi:hypothetical protein